MKRIFHLMIGALAAVVIFSGCQKYDDSEIRQEIKELGDKVAALEAWCRSSQEAVDNVAKLKEAVDGMWSVGSVESFDEDGATGYVIIFTNGKSIKLYNGKDGKDGDTFFGNVNVGSSSVEFILADGTRFVVDRVTASISFDSFETETIVRGDTIWTVMNEAFRKSEYAAFMAELKMNDGTAASVTTKSASENGLWEIEAIAPEFNAAGGIARPAGVVIRNAPETGGKGVLKVTLITNDGRDVSSSLVVDVVPNYLTFEAVEAGATVSMEIVGRCDAPSLKYSTDLTEWTTFDFGNPQTITLKNVGDKVYWRNTGKAEAFSKDIRNFIHFVLGEKKVSAGGNVMSLVDGSCGAMTIPGVWCFTSLFLNAASLLNAPALPATHLDEACYYKMFSGCRSLEVAPELPATDLPTDCYSYMFQSCSSLAEAPDILAAKAGSGSCFSMFIDCTSLKKAPALPARQLGAFCYQQMFYGCSSLEEAPELPATELSTYCYASMFSECTSLKEAPSLPAVNLDHYCYYAMFWGCSSLGKAPELPVTELSESCYYGMFVNCLSLKNAPALPAMHLAKSCYFQMFAGCESLEEAPELPADELFYACYYSMFWGCSSLIEAPALPATKLAVECYGEMFGYSGLKKAPELPAMDLAPCCYDYMFEVCESLEEGPYLPAKQLYPGCYEGMFEKCTNLRHIKVGFEDWGDGSATDGWVAGVPSGGLFECPDGLELKYGEGFVPAGWSVNGAAPVASGSFAAPASKSIRDNHRKLLAPKIPEIHDGHVGPVGSLDAAKSK